MSLRRIISGGQTGVDRGAIGAALNAGFPYGGWVPLGRQAEDGRVPDCFTEMVESPGGYRRRTQQNVDDGDATLILNVGPKLTGGTLLTAEIAQKAGTQLLILDVGMLLGFAQVRDIQMLDLMVEYTVSQIQMWLRTKWLGLHPIHTLNVAGPRESKAQGIESLTYTLMQRVISGVLQEA